MRIVYCLSMSICASMLTVTGMIEHGIVEASSYTPSRVLSPTLHTVGDFVEVCYHGEKGETSTSSDTQTQEAVQSTGMAPSCSTVNGSSSSDWKTVEESLITSSVNTDTLTFIPCESGLVQTATDNSESEIVLNDNGLGDSTVKCGNESPGVHSTRSKNGIMLADMVTVPASLTTDNGVNSCLANTDTQAHNPSTEMKTAPNGMVI